MTGASCEGEGLIEGSPASASFDVFCGDAPPDKPPYVGDFCSQTQVGWGTDECNGNNTYLRNGYFDGFFPSGLVVGDPDGPDADSLYAILLTTSAAVADYLARGRLPGGTDGRPDGP